MKARHTWEPEKQFLWVLSLVIISLPILFASALLYYVIELISETSFSDLFNLQGWIPSQGKISFLPFIFGTLFVTIIALLLAFPLSLGIVIYLSEYGKPKLKAVVRPFIDLIAGLPSVIFGLWGLAVIVPFIKDVLAPVFNRVVTGYCSLAAGMVLAFMVMPFLIQIMLEIFEAIPHSLRETGFSLGASRWQVINNILLRKARPGIMAALVLAFARAFGETLAVMMVVGGIPQITIDPFEPVATLPLLIANNYGEMSSLALYQRLLFTASFLLLLIVAIFTFISRLILSRLKKEIE